MVTEFVTKKNCGAMGKDLNPKSGDESFKLSHQLYGR